MKRKLVVAAALLGSGFAASCTTTGGAYRATSTRTPTSTVPATITPTPTISSTVTPTLTSAPPLAVIVVNKTAVRIWEPVCFDGRQSTGGPPLSFAWSFGDGASTGREVTHHYVQPGTYTATLTVTGPGGTNATSVAITVSPESAPNLSLAAQLPLPSLSGGLWAKGNLVFVPQFVGNERVHVVDVSIPSAPVVAATVTGIGRVQEVRAVNRLLITSREQPPAGAFTWTIQDVSTPTAPTLVGQFGQNLIASHTIGTWDNMVLVHTGRTSPPHITMYDISNPAAPTTVGTWSGSSDGVHDTQRVGNRLYVAAELAGFYVLDVTNPASPSTIIQHAVGSGYYHNIWPDKTGSYVFTTEEVFYGIFEAWDISNPPNAVKVGQWNPPAGVQAGAHNAVVVGDYAYIAWYKYGLVVLNVSNPANPTLVYHYDTYPADDGPGYDGAWMVYPFGERVYVSDTVGGLFIFNK